MGECWFERVGDAALKTQMLLVQIANDFLSMKLALHTFSQNATLSPKSPSDEKPVRFKHCYYHAVSISF